MTAMKGQALLLRKKASPCVIPAGDWLLFSRAADNKCLYPSQYHGNDRDKTGQALLLRKKASPCVIPTGDWLLFSRAADNKCLYLLMAQPGIYVCHVSERDANTLWIFTGIF